MPELVESPSEVTATANAAASLAARVKPFPGLRPFDETNADFFFGRTSQRAELVRSLNRARFLAVIGVSGGGKSSLVRAGLIPDVQKGYLGSGTKWRIATLRPGDSPVERLANALERALGGSGNTAAALTTELREGGEAGLVSVARRLDPGYNLLVFVDQFEELFRYKDLSQAGGEAEGAAAEAVSFVGLLLGALRDSRIYVVITMRSDFIGDCAQFTGLPDKMNAGQYLVPRLTIEEQREVIRGPVVAYGRRIRSEHLPIAKRLVESLLAGVDSQPRNLPDEVEQWPQWARDIRTGAVKLTVSKDLVERLCTDLGSEPKQLPILQHALMKIWDYHWANVAGGSIGEGWATIEAKDYEAVGGFLGALNKHAEDIYRELGPEDQWIAQRLFRRITIKDASGRVARRPTKLKDIYAITDTADDPRRKAGDARQTAYEARRRMVLKVIERYQRDDCSFLAPFDVPATGDSGTDDERWVDITHESLCALWKSLRKWVELEAASANQFRMVLEQAELHERDRKKKGYLDQAQLAYVLGTFHPLDKSSRDSSTREDYWTAAWSRRYASDAEYKDVIRYLIASQDEELRRREVEERANAADLVEKKNELIAKDVELAQEKTRRAQREKKLWIGIVALAAALAVLFVVLLNRSQTRVASNRMRQAEQQQDPHQALAYLADAMRQDPESAARARVMFSNMTAYDYLSTRIFAHDAVVNSAAFSADGKRVVTAAADGVVRVWDADTARTVEMPNAPKSFAARHAEFDPDVNTTLILVASDDGTARLWDWKRTATEEMTVSWLRRTFSWFVQIARKAPNVPGTEADAVQALNACDPSNPFNPSRPSCTAFPVNGARFSPDGSKIVTASGNGTVQVWRADNGQPLGTPLRPRGDAGLVAATDARFSADGKSYVAAWLDDKVQVASVPGLDSVPSQPLDLSTAIRGYPEGYPPLLLKSAEFSPDGKFVAAASYGSFGPAYLWHLRKGSDVEAPLTLWIAKYSNGVTTAVAGEGDSVKLWDLATGLPMPPGPKGVSPLQAALRGKTPPIGALRFSCDGTWVITAAEDGTVVAWNLSLSEVQPHLVSQGSDSDGRPLPAHRAGIKDIDFDCSRTDLTHPRFLTGSADGIAQVWQVGDPPKAPLDETVLPLGPPFYHKDAVHSAGFSGDGGSIVTASADHTARLWLVNGPHDRPDTQRVSVEGQIRAIDIDETSGKLAIATSGGVGVVDPGQEKAARLSIPDQEAKSIGFSRDGKWMATGYDNNDVQIWDGNKPAPGGRQTHPGGRGIQDVAFSPDGTWLATGSKNGTVKLWRVSGKGELTPQGKDVLAARGPITSVEFSPDGRSILAASLDNDARLWDRITGELKQQFHHEAGVNSAAFSPDGKRVVTASNDGTARVWNSNTGIGIAELRAATALRTAVRTAAFSSDGKLVVTVSLEGPRIWDADTGLPLGPPIAGREKTVISWARFSRDGKWLLTADVADEDQGTSDQPPFSTSLAPERGIGRWPIQAEEVPPAGWFKSFLARTLWWPCTSCDFLEAKGGYFLKEEIPVPLPARDLSQAEVGGRVPAAAAQGSAGR